MQGSVWGWETVSKRRRHVMLNRNNRWRGRRRKVAGKKERHINIDGLKLVVIAFLVSNFEVKLGDV